MHTDDHVRMWHPWLHRFWRLYLRYACNTKINGLKTTRRPNSKAALTMMYWVGYDMFWMWINNEYHPNEKYPNCYELPPLVEVASLMISFGVQMKDGILIGYKSWCISIFRNFMLITGISTHIPQSDIIHRLIEPEFIKSFYIFQSANKYFE